MDEKATKGRPGASAPWYRRTLRWGQTNLTEIDPARYDHDWWRAQWQRTRVQGLIVNAGGFVAYYPSRFPLQQRATALDERDLFGEIAQVAHEDGIVVLARMDSNRAGTQFYIEHPDWFAVGVDGAPVRAGEHYVACVNSPYYREYLPDVLREIIVRDRPEGFTDNSWSGPLRTVICQCDYCARSFRAHSGLTLPRQADWDDPVYRQWICWSYQCRLEVWDLNNEVTRAEGGPHCLWIGMNAGDPIAQANHFRDSRAIYQRSKLVMLDWQYRRSDSGFHTNRSAGQLVHALAGWGTVVAESTALYAAGSPSFRLASKPEQEVRLWALEGFAGGLSPWWHHIGSYHEDRRQYRSAEPLFGWHAENEEYLVRRQPLAQVGVVWSQRSLDFYGRDQPNERVMMCDQGVAEALLEARIPYLPIELDDVGPDMGEIRVIVLPNVAAMSEHQCQKVREFVAEGGGLIATGETSLYDEWGDRRSDFALGSLLGVRSTGAHHGDIRPVDPSWETWATHTYLRLPPGRQGSVDRPRDDNSPVPAPRHPILAGLEETDLIPFGGRLEVVIPDPSTEVLATFVPPFPIYPPELAWPRQRSTSLPGLVISGGPGRVAYLAADLDRCLARHHAQDHALVIANLVRWALADPERFSVKGPGLLDCQLYAQPGRLLLHVVNLTNPGAWRPPVTELVPVGPQQVTIRADDLAVRPRTAELRVSGGRVTLSGPPGRLQLLLQRILDHELLVLEDGR